MILRSSSLLVLALVIALPVPLFAESLVGSGCSVSVPGYLHDLAKAYEKETGVAVLVLGGGSIRGLADLREGRMDFAASCLSKAGAGGDDFEYVIASWDALVFIVNKGNPVSNITPEQVKAVYEGRINNWKELGGENRSLVSVISAAKRMGGIGESLSAMFLGGKWPEKQKNSTMQASSTTVWEQIVEEMPEAFASTGFGSARKRSVKMLKVNGTAPTKQTIISGKYPYRRPLYIVIKKNPDPKVRKFVDFVLSSRGQKLISSYGMPSLLDVK